MKKMRRSYRKPRIPLAVGIAITLVCLALLFFYTHYFENKSKQPEARGDYRQRYAYDNVIDVDGETYRQRKELTTILLMGIDQDSDAQIVGYRSGGQADFLRLLVFDPNEKMISQLAIDRDTITPIRVLGVLGNRIAVRELQICLSHGYGDGKEQSCEFTVEATKNLLLGTEITHYIAMNLDGISVLNDWAGGVTVKLQDDFSMVDPMMIEGSTLTLAGNQAEIFVRARKDVSDGTNASRMVRQTIFLQNLADQISERLKREKDEISSLYDTLEPFLVTDFSRGRIINESWAAKDYQLHEPIEIPGEHKIGNDGFMEYHVNEDALKEIVLELFFEEV